MTDKNKKDSSRNLLNASLILPSLAAAAIALLAWSRLHASDYSSKLLLPVKPPSKLQLANQLSLVNQALTERESPTIHLMWTTPPETFTLLNFKVLDSYFYHDPSTTIVVHATHLKETHFSSYIQSGYNITISPISDDKIWSLATTPTSQTPSPCPGTKWLENIQEYRRIGPYFYSHLTDYLRFCILYKHGGVYSDFDAIQLSKWNHPLEFPSKPVETAFIGEDSATGSPTPKMGFERTSYDPFVFNAVGPKAVTLAYKELDEKRLLVGRDAVQVLKRNVLYPYSYLTSWEVFKSNYSLSSTNGDDNGEAGGERLIRKGLSLHLYGHKTKGMAAEEGSVLDYIVRKQSIIKRGYRFAGLNISDVDPNVRGESLAGDLPKHELRVPRYLSIARYIQEVPDIRIVADIRALEGVNNERDATLLVSLRLSTNHGKIRIASASSGTTPSLNDKDWSSEIVLENLTPAAANKQLSRLIYYATASRLPLDETDTLTITATFPTSASTSPITKTIPIYNLPNLVTIMVKTTDRMSKVFQLVSSVLHQYPNISIIVSDDGHLDPAKTTKPEGPQRGFYYLPLPHDVGLSAGRNRMVEKIRTKYVLTLDDDFTVDQDGQLGALIHALETPPAINPDKQYDIAAGKIPADEGRFGVDYCGLMTVSDPGRTLRLDPGRITPPGTTHEGCIQVDFVPNVFIARTQFLRETLRWDETLKLGEHEDFFWRAKQIGVRTLTCPGVTFYHDQVAHWKGVTEYDKKRARVYDFFKLSLRKHGFVRLVSFGRTIMDLVLPKPVENLQAANILSRSILLTWTSTAPSFKILQSDNGGMSWSPINHGQGENYEHEPHRISSNPDGFQRRTSENWITVYGLKPGSAYLFRIHAGNRFLFLEGGVVVSVAACSAQEEGARNLLINPRFDASPASIYPYTVSSNNTYKLVPTLHQDQQQLTSDQQQQEPSKSLLKYRKGGWSSNLGLRSEITTVGYLLPHRSLASISQFIPGSRISRHGSLDATKILVSMQSKIDALFDAQEGMSWRVNVQVWYSKLGPHVSKSDVSGWIGVDENEQAESEGNIVQYPLLEWGRADVEWKEEFDRSNTEWQGRTVCVCVAEGGWMGRVKGVLVSGVLETFRGSVTWDDWVVVVE
ncbi:UNVERIFIED_CONTAM: hypothetical protein HDU68_008100 [Siphonaria sp. JEL0065]|nr:hypothetical protein HDU68_008100 [Siphonaria sp. JEL0065]